MGSSGSNNNGSFYNVNIIILIITIIAYVVNQKILKLTNYIFFQYYFNDLLAPIIILSFSNYLLNLYNKVIKGKNVYLFIIICGIFWEIITPLYKKNSVSDIVDFIMYIMGANIYMLIVKGVKVNEKTKW